MVSPRPPSGAEEFSGDELLRAAQETFSAGWLDSVDATPETRSHGKTPREMIETGKEDVIRQEVLRRMHGVTS